jgi:Ca-activated chloride channel family protein
MFRFGAAEMLLGLLALPAVGVFLYITRRQVRRAVAAFGDPLLVQRLSADVNRRGRTVKAILIVGVLGLLVIAMARPQFGTRVETVRRQGLDVMVAIDVSRSMLAEDIAPNRLVKAKFIVSDLIRRLDGDRIGLVAFAGEAFIQSPLTLDYAAASLFLNAMEPDMVSVQGTDLGAALATSLDAFEAGTNQHRVLITITDGEDHEGAIDEAVARAQEEAVRIFAIGMGTPDGVPIPEYDGAGRRTGFVRDDDGTVVTSRLDEATLTRITEATGGAYYRATPRGSELNELGRELTGEEGQELEAQQVTRFEEQFQMFLAMALILLVVEMLVPDRRSLTARWIGRA